MERCFTFQWGGGLFVRWKGFIFKWRVHPMGVIGFDGGGRFPKKSQDGGACSPLWEALYCVGAFFAHGYTKLIFAVPTTHDQ